MDGLGADYLSEQVWNSGDMGYSWGGNGVTNDFWGSGGGVSADYAIPYWQTNIDMTTNLGSTTLRNIPDVALTADNVYITYGSGTNGLVGGTSCAAPLWAGFMALANQQAAGMNLPSAGFINPAIYALGASTNYAACFHDITTGDNTWPGSPDLYYAVPGYDLCTGWGTPAGTNLINYLVGSPPDSLQIWPLGGFVAIGAPGGPFNGTAQAFNVANVGANPMSWSLINTSAWLAVSSPGGWLGAGAQTNVTVSLSSLAGGLPPGIYSATVFFTNQATGIVQPRSFWLQTGQSLVLDGGFESGTFSYWTLAGNTVSGRTIYNAVEDSMDYSANYPYVAHSGNYGAFLGDVSLAVLYQTLPTCPGQEYLLSFWLNNLASSPGQFFEVNWNTNDPATNTIFSFSNPPSFSWTNLTFVLAATGTNTVLQFGAENPPNYFGLDDISVLPIPAPSFTAIAAESDGVTLAWNTLANVGYVIQYATNLADPEWLDLGGPCIAVTNTLTMEDTNAFDVSEQRFYRVLVSP
jgi:hypothetical protein